MKTKKKTIKKTKKRTRTIAATKETIRNVKAGFLEKKQKIAIKQFAYIATSIFLGLLIGMFLYWFIELVYINQMLRDGIVLRSSRIMGSECYLPGIVKILFLFGGLIFGVSLGFWGWQKVYVEHRHR